MTQYEIFKIVQQTCLHSVNCECCPYYEHELKHCHYAPNEQDLKPFEWNLSKLID